jgi:hypothetical protein
VQSNGYFILLAGWLLWQDWLERLPPGFASRIRRGVRVDPRTLRGEAGFYSEPDANCCPSERLVVDLKLEGDSLTLKRYQVIADQGR